MAVEQLNIFEELNETYHITKPIRLIEFFSGIGAQAKSLEILGVPFETYKTCEWSKESIKAYKQIHHTNEHIEINLTKEELIEKVRGISSNYNEPMSDDQLKRLSLEELSFIHECNLINHNLIDISNVKGKDLEIVDTDKYEYILTYSFPCQDLSLGGQQAGVAEGSGTRSSLLWQVSRIISECENKPQILVMENVDMLVSNKFKKHFDKFLNELKELGYESFWKVMNAKEYGIPQNRKRVFCISILGNGNQYKFPRKIKLTHVLKDLLDHNVDEKYYLSIKMLKCFLYPSKSGKKFGRTKNFINGINCDIAKAITTKAGSRDGDNYIQDSLFIKNATKKGYLEANEGDGIDISSRMEKHRGNVQKGMAQTLTTMGGNNVGVVVKDTENYIEWKQKGRLDVDCRAAKEDKIAMALTTSPKSKVLTNLRIRKLTPCECYKLMGFTRTDFEHCKAIQSDSRLWHQAGDSIVTTCLCGIFGTMFDLDYQAIIKNYVKELVND